MPARRPFTGIHEIYRTKGSNVPHEGGGKLRPFGEDIFQRVVDVNFGGGNGAVFISGDYCCYLRAVGMAEPTLNQTWLGMGSLDFGDGGGNYASSYGIVNGTPTFLMSGYRNWFAGQVGDIIMLSHDAINWQTVLFDGTGAGLYYLAWDPEYGPSGAFFAAGGSVGGSYMSNTGYDWVFMGAEDFYSHCPSGIPDGLVGIDYENDIMILPQDVPEDIIWAECTAFCGGIWMAGGRTPGGGTWMVDSSCTASSIDGGQTWQVVTAGPMGMTGDFAVLCISGAPWGDFPWSQPEPTPEPTPE